MEQISHSLQKARKEHKCDYCNGTIKIREVYEKSFLKYDDIPYVWKSHKSCSGLASKLRWFDKCDEGLTKDEFLENVAYEYQHIMGMFYTEIYESKDFKFPSVFEQLDFIKKHHQIY